jgi:methyl-accepting chemotaxis protein
VTGPLDPAGGPARLASLPRPERVSRFLIGYGIVGIAAAVIGLVLLVLALARVNGLADRIGGDFGAVTGVLDRTATVLETASSTAGGFGATVEGSASAVTTAADDVRAIVPRLRDLETQANSVNVLGSQPLSPLAGLFGQIATQLDDLDTRLDSVATALTSNQSGVQSISNALADLATQTRTLSERLGGGALTAAIDDARWLIVALLGVSTIGALVPAVGGLVAGLWLRQWLRGAAVAP